ncbi:MAG: ABC transporter permease [Candidatus Bathyarchaeia archaeon]
MSLVLKSLVVREVKVYIKNPAFIMSIILLISIYGVLGRIIGIGTEIAIEEQLKTRIGVVLEEDTPLIEVLLGLLNQTSGGKISIFSSSSEAIRETGLSITIPLGFTENVTSVSKPVRLRAEVKIDSISPLSSQAKTGFVANIASLIQNFIPIAFGMLYNVSMPSQKIVISETSILMYNREFSSGEFNAIASFAALIPTILGVVIGINTAYAAQSTAVEKVEKAFEMLLSQPIPRRSVVIAKIIGSFVASLITGTAYFVGMLLMFSGFMPTSASQQTTSEVTIDLINLLGMNTIILSILSLIIGLIYSGAIGVILGSIVSDERIAGALSTPITFLFIGVGLATIYMGLPLNALTAVIAGVTIAPLPYIFASVSFMGEYNLIVISTATGIASCTLLIALASILFNRDIVILGLRFSWRRKMLE